MRSPDLGGLALALTSHSRSPIDIFVTYEGKRPTDLAQSKYAVRHMIAAEVCPSCTFTSYMLCLLIASPFKIEAECAARHAEAVDKTSGEKKVAAIFGQRQRKRAPVLEEDGDEAQQPPPMDDDVPEEAGGKDVLTRVDKAGSLPKKVTDTGKIDIADKVSEALRRSGECLPPCPLTSLRWISSVVPSSKRNRCRRDGKSPTSQVSRASIAVMFEA